MCDVEDDKKLEDRIDDLGNDSSLFFKFISLLLLIFTVTISSIVIRIATIALEITGMPEEQAHFQALSSWASDNKDVLSEDISFHVENSGTMKADFTVSNVSLILLEKEFHYILSFHFF